MKFVERPLTLAVLMLLLTLHLFLEQVSFGSRERRSHWQHWAQGVQSTGLKLSLNEHDRWPTSKTHWSQLQMFAPKWRETKLSFSHRVLYWHTFIITFWYLCLISLHQVISFAGDGFLVLPWMEVLYHFWEAHLILLQVHFCHWSWQVLFNHSCHLLYLTVLKWSIAGIG